MSKLINALIVAIHSAADSNAVPEWLHLLPATSFSGVDGRGPYSAPDAAALISLFQTEGHKLPVDENHSTDLAAKHGHPAPARGWIVELQSRDDGIWGKVEWTNSGRELMQDKSYGYLSPVFLHTAAKPYRIAKLQRVALTNDPNLKLLTSLHSRQENDMLEELRKALGLPETADEAAVLAAVSTAHAAQTAQTANAALMSRITEAAGVTADAAPDVLISAINTKRAPSATDAENANLKGQLVSLQSQFTALATTTAQDKAVAAIDAAIESGKVVPALRDHFIARHTKNPTEVETELKLMPSLNAGGLGNRQLPAEGQTASADELSVASMMGVDPEAFKKQHQTLFGKGA